MDEYIVKWKRLVFARLAEARPLLITAIGGANHSEGPFWQWFIYKNLNSVYFHCGHFHSEELCLMNP